MVRSYRSPTRRAAVAVLTLGLLGALSTSVAAQEFDGSADIQLGDTLTAGFPLDPPGEHAYAFFGEIGTILSVEVKATTGGTAPALRLTRPGGDVVSVGSRLHTSRSGKRIRIRRFVLPFSGYYELRLKARAGSGNYRLSTRGNAPKTVSIIYPDLGGATTRQFTAQQGATIKAKVRARGRRARGARPTITGLTAPNGDPVAIAATSTGSTAKMNRVSAEQTGTYVLAFTNGGASGDLRVDVTVTGPNRNKLTRTFGTSTGMAAATVETSGSLLDPRADYVGSVTCGKCHDEIFRAWSVTAHNSAVRSWERPGLGGVALVNDLDGDGDDDFVEGLDLATQPAFAHLGANAPKLSFVEGDEFPAKVTIGEVTYDVVRVMGGNGLWRQRYLTKMGRSHYVLPIQFNEGDPLGYVGYAVSDWYDEEGQPRFGNEDQITQEISYESGCAGCHGVGATVGRDPASGDFLAGHVEVNIGCEQCHGPGRRHANTGDVDKIVNPANLLDGTAAGTKAAVDVCARCHVRGEAHDPLPDSEFRPAYGFRRDQGVQQLGDAQEDFLELTSDPDEFWGFKPNPFPADPGPTFVAARDPQRARELQAGPHASTSGFAPTCFSCHDPHGRDQDHQILTRIENRGVRTATRANDNTLCLACHAGDAPFDDITKEDLGGLDSSTDDAGVVQSVVDHMKDIGMPVATFRYDPDGESRVGNCMSCHMPLTGVFGSSRTDAAGYVEGDMHSHTFKTIWPRASVLHGVTNSCSTCHPTGQLDEVADIIEQWVHDGDDDDGTFHADTPSFFQNGMKNTGRDGGVTCAECHTTEGFIRIQQRGETLDQDAIDGIVKSAIAGEEGITCRACHGEQSNCTFASGANPLRFPANELCGRCHNDETIKFEDFDERGEIVTHATREMLAGTAGSEVPGSGGYGDTAHSSSGLFPDGCIECHYHENSAEDLSHDFAPQISTCSACHGGLDTFDRPSSGDWDGNGENEGIQTEVRGLLDVLRDALLEDPLITFDGSLFRYDRRASMEGASTAQKRAAFNHYTVNGEGSFGVHNARRTVQLLQRSYAEVTGEPVPGADLR